MTSSWFFLSTLNYDARSTTHQTYCVFTVLRYSWWWTVDLSETCRVLYQINLRNSATRCLLLKEYITVCGPLYGKVLMSHYIPYRAGICWISERLSDFQGRHSCSFKHFTEEGHVVLSTRIQRYDKLIDDLDNRARVRSIYSVPTEGHSHTPCYSGIIFKPLLLIPLCYQVSAR